MNRTTVKRGIGAVILALIAAALLAFLLKDKAAQRQEVVEIALPGSEDNAATSSQTTRLPTLTTDNSEGGSVIANAGSGTGNDATNSSTGNSPAASSTATTATANTGSTDGTASSNSDGAIIASAAAVGTAAAAGAAATAASATKSVDFSVKPKATSASSEFLDLDLVNNGESSASNNTASGNATAAAAASTVSVAPAKAAQDTGKTDQGTVIASTAPRSNNSSNNTVQPRLIGEKRTTPVKSSNTARVVTKKAPSKASKPSSASSSSSTKQAKNGYAIQLLATSSQTRANNLKNVMAGEGYSAYVTKTKQNGKTLFRVRIGKYSAKSAALKVQAQMKRRYKKNTNVNRSAVVAR